MADTPNPESIDPNAKRCPVCGYPRRWRGQHAAQKHPEWWARFNDIYESVEIVRTEWVPRG